MKRKILWSIVVFVTILFLTTSLVPAYTGTGNNEQATYASTDNNEQYDLPVFLLRLSEHLSRGNASELARLRNEMVQAEKLKQERIKSTNGAVLHSPSSRGGTRDGGYMRYIESVIGHSEPMYGPTGRIGYIDDWYYLEGSEPDGNLAYLEAIGWYDSVGGEACAHGQLNAPVYSSSDVYVWAKKGPLTGSPPLPPWAYWKNYVMVMNAYNPQDEWDWHWVGYAQAYSSQVTDYYIGP
jgi:hypothetical protein